MSDRKIAFKRNEFPRQVRFPPVRGHGRDVAGRLKRARSGPLREVRFDPSRDIGRASRELRQLSRNVIQISD
jgi:hypothetical protein